MFTPLPLFPRLPRPHPLAACLTLALGFGLTAAQAENPDEAAFPALDRLDSTLASPSQVGALRAKSSGYSPRHTTPSSASTHYVDTCADDNSAHSLRTLVGLAASGDTIDLTQIPMPCSTITLDDTQVPSQLEINQDVLYIVGPGASALAIDGDNHSRIFAHYGATLLSINGLTLTNGYRIANGTSDVGGCVYSNATVDVMNSSITNCAVLSEDGMATAKGGAIFTGGSLNLLNSTISGNAAHATPNGPEPLATAGGGAYVHGDLFSKYSSIDGNSATSSPSHDAIAGGVFVGGHTKLEYSTISNNYARTAGAMYVGPSTSTMIYNSTVSGNSSAVVAAIYSNASTLNISNSTIAFNTSSSTPAALYINAAPLFLQSSIVADNVSANGEPGDLGGTSVIVTGADDLITSSSIAVPFGTSFDCPQLQPLSDNGGPTRTHALGHASPAIDAGNNSSNFVSDQRGTPRVNGANADIGAFEWHGEAEDRISVSGFDGLCDQ